MHKILRWFESNLTSLVLALLLALSVWIVASLDQNPPEEADLPGAVPIDITGLAPNLIITNDYSKTVNVRLRAQQETWRSLSSEDVVATVDLSNLEPGSHTVRVNFEVNSQAILVAANPSHIRIDLEERYERELPVQLSLNGEPAIGYIVGQVALNPSLVTVQGPRSRVQLISEVRATANIEGSRSSFRNALQLIALDSDGNRVENVTIAPLSVEVTVPITQEAGYRDISVLVSTIGRPAPGYYVTGILSTPQRITVQGDPSVIESMQPYAETDTIDLTNLTDDLIREVPLNLPPGVTPIDSQTVEVLISIAAQLSSRTVLDVPVQGVGLGDPLAATFSPNNLDVILSGPLTVLDGLDPATDITALVDLTGLGPGTFQLEPRVEISNGDVQVESVFPIVIEVTIAPDTSPPGN
jgi:YbbR domain-containing protein